MFLRRFPASSDASTELSDMGDSRGSDTGFLARGASVDVDRGWWTRVGRLVRGRASNPSAAFGDVGVGRGDGNGGWFWLFGERGSAALDPNDRALSEPRSGLDGAVDGRLDFRVRRLVGDSADAEILRSRVGSFQDEDGEDEDGDYSR